jgi:hypothetical protein
VPECPRCKLVCASESICDFGYDFSLPPDRQPPSKPSASRSPASVLRTIGILLLASSLVMWLVFAVGWSNDNNLYCLLLIYLIPISAVLLLLGFIFVIVGSVR